MPKTTGKGSSRGPTKIPSQNVHISWRILHLRLDDTDGQLSLLGSTKLLRESTVRPNRLERREAVIVPSQRG